MKNILFGEGGGRSKNSLSAFAKREFRDDGLFHAEYVGVNRDACRRRAIQSDAGKRTACMQDAYGVLLHADPKNVGVACQIIGRLAGCIVIYLVIGSDGYCGGAARYNGNDVAPIADVAASDRNGSSVRLDADAVDNACADENDIAPFIGGVFVIQIQTQRNDCAVRKKD